MQGIRGLWGGAVLVAVASVVAHDRDVLGQTYEPEFSQEIQINPSTHHLDSFTTGNHEVSPIVRVGSNLFFVYRRDNSCPAAFESSINDRLAQAFWGDAFDVVVYQQIADVDDTKSYVGKAWVKAESGVTFSIGIGPSGETDPTAGTIEWTDNAYTSSDVWNWEEIETSSAVDADDTTITLFIKASHTSGSSKRAWVDFTNVYESTDQNETNLLSNASFESWVTDGGNTNFDVHKTADDWTIAYYTGSAWSTTPPEEDPYWGEYDTNISHVQVVDLTQIHDQGYEPEDDPVTLALPPENSLSDMYHWVPSIFRMHDTLLEPTDRLLVLDPDREVKERSEDTAYAPPAHCMIDDIDSPSSQWTISYPDPLGIPLRKALDGSQAMNDVPDYISASDASGVYDPTTGVTHVVLEGSTFNDPDVEGMEHGGNRFYYRVHDTDNDGIAEVDGPYILIEGSYGTPEGLIHCSGENCDCEGETCQSCWGGNVFVKGDIVLGNETSGPRSLHLIWTIRDTFGAQETENDPCTNVHWHYNVYYARSDDGGDTWHSLDGETTVNIAGSGTREHILWKYDDDEEEDPFRVYTGDVYQATERMLDVDSNNYPVIIVKAYDSGGEMFGDHINAADASATYKLICYRWNGTTWESNVVNASANWKSASPKVHVDEQDRIWIFHQGEGGLETAGQFKPIYTYSDDGGETWASWTAVPDLDANRKARKLTLYRDPATKNRLFLGIRDRSTNDLTFVEMQVCDSTLQDPDPDSDDLCSTCDNCPNDANADQGDLDGDGVGDACDSDRDGDGVANGSDNCPDLPNANQADMDSDTTGDVCDSDRDGDGVANASDNCPDDSNSNQADADSDDIGDVCDNCPDDSNADQADHDADGLGDVCDECNDYVVQDYNVDDDVDVGDYARYQLCFSGANQAYPTGVDGCSCMDADNDEDVDVADFAKFQLCFSGPGVQSPCYQTTPASSGTVTFELLSDQDGQTISAGTDVVWRVAVTVTGDTQGLAAYAFDLELHSGSASGPLVETTLSTALWSRVYNVNDQAGSPLPRVNDSYELGGPYMATSSYGTANGSGQLFGVGDGYGAPWTYDSASTRMSWGIGLASRKSYLLDDAQGAYELRKRAIDTTGFDAGTYVLKLIPGAVSVLRDDVDLEEDITGNFAIEADSISGPDTITFTIGE